MTCGFLAGVAVIVNDCVTPGAAVHAALPDWLAAMVQAPGAMGMTIRAVKPGVAHVDGAQTAGVCEAKLTSNPEVAEALRSPRRCVRSMSGSSGNCMICGRGPGIESDCVTGA